MQALQVVPIHCQHIVVANKVSDLETTTAAVQLNPVQRRRSPAALIGAFALMVKPRYRRYRPLLPVRGRPLQSGAA
jgi:hypothetical protein